MVTVVIGFDQVTWPCVFTDPFAARGIPFGFKQATARPLAISRFWALHPVSTTMPAARPAKMGSETTYTNRIPPGMPPPTTAVAGLLLYPCAFGVSATIHLVCSSGTDLYNIRPTSYSGRVIIRVDLKVIVDFAWAKGAMKYLAPLAVYRASTLAEDNLVGRDLTYRNHVGEIFVLPTNPVHRGIFVPNMAHNEVLLLT
jgi:hypothetical protein